MDMLMYAIMYMYTLMYISFLLPIMPRTVTATQARKDFFKLAKQAKVPGHFVSITMDGLPAVTMMSTDEFEGWQETLEVLSDPQLVKDIREAEAEMKRGVKGIPLDEAFKQLGW